MHCDHELEVAFGFIGILSSWCLLDRNRKTFCIRVKTDACLDSLAVASFFLLTALPYKVWTGSLGRDVFEVFLDMHCQ